MNEKLNFDLIHTLSEGTISLLYLFDLLKPRIRIIIRDMQVLIQPYGKSEISLSFLSGFTEPVLNAVRNRILHFHAVLNLKLKFCDYFMIRLEHCKICIHHFQSR